MTDSNPARNINVFGLAFVTSFSVFVTVLDIMLLRFLIFISRFRRVLAPRIDQWIQDGVWQLQRRAYEAQGCTGWNNLEKEIPLTNEIKRVNTLSILDKLGKEERYREKARP